jgi:hypothetical protein
MRGKRKSTFSKKDKRFIKRMIISLLVIWVVIMGSMVGYQQYREIDCEVIVSLSVSYFYASSGNFSIWIEDESFMGGRIQNSTPIIGSGRSAWTTFHIDHIGPYVIWAGISGGPWTVFTTEEFELDKSDDGASLRFDLALGG